MNKDDIITRLKVLDFDPKEYWVITGSAMVLQGVKTETSDIDLGCTRSLADSLEKSGYRTIYLEDGTRKIVIDADVEIFEDWLYDKVEIIDDIPVMSLRGIIEMKSSLGREKDYADIALIKSLFPIE